MAKPKLGDGRRFSSLKASLSRQKGVKNPGALAAAIGRRKFGGKKMGSMARRGKQRLMLHQKIARGMSPRS